MRSAFNCPFLTDEEIQSELDDAVKMKAESGGRVRYVVVGIHGKNGWYASAMDMSFYKDMREAEEYYGGEPVYLICEAR